MRSREDIECNMFDSYEFEAIAIELLLDIRELLSTQKKSESEELVQSDSSPS